MVAGSIQIFQRNLCQIRQSQEGFKPLRRSKIILISRCVHVVAADTAQHAERWVIIELSQPFQQRWQRFPWQELSAAEQWRNWFGSVNVVHRACNTSAAEGFRRFLCENVPVAGLSSLAASAAINASFGAARKGLDFFLICLASRLSKAAARVDKVMDSWLSCRVSHALYRSKFIRFPTTPSVA